MPLCFVENIVVLICFGVNWEQNYELNSCEGLNVVQFKCGHCQGCHHLCELPHCQGEVLPSLMRVQNLTHKTFCPQNWGLNMNKLLKKDHPTQSSSKK